MKPIAISVALTPSSLSWLPTLAPTVSLATISATVPSPKRLSITCMISLPTPISAYSSGNSSALPTPAEALPEHPASPSSFSTSP